MGIQSKNISNFHIQEENLCDGFDISSWEVSLYDNFCIFNLPKLASSLLQGWNSCNNNLLCEAFVTFNTDTGKIIKSNTKDGIGDSNKHLETFTNIWNKQFDGEPSEYKFIFLMRNPTHKFISGIMEDTFVRTYGGESNLPTFNESLTKFSTLYLNWKHNMIELGHSKTMLDEFKNDNVPINCKTSIKEKYLDIYRDTILMPFKEYIKSNTYHQPHTSIDIFFLHSLVLKSTKRTFSNSAIRIFDLDKENILQLLKELIGSDVGIQELAAADTDGTNKRGDLPRLIFYEYIIHNTEVLNYIKKLVRLDEYCWFELINKMYPKHLYEKVMSDTISPYNHYKKRYYIKEDSDLNKLETYAQWQDHMSISVQAYLREN